MTNTIRNEILKKNAILLAVQHKEKCNDPECNVSTTLIAELILKAGITLTKEELTELA